MRGVTGSWRMAIVASVVWLACVPAPGDGDPKALERGAALLATLDGVDEGLFVAQSLGFYWQDELSGRMHLEVKAGGAEGGPPRYAYAMRMRMRIKLGEHSNEVTATEEGLLDERLRVIEVRGERRQRIRGGPPEMADGQTMRYSCRPGAQPGSIAWTQQQGSAPETTKEVADVDTLAPSAWLFTRLWLRLPVDTAHAMRVLDTTNGNRSPLQITRAASTTVAIDGRDREVVELAMIERPGAAPTTLRVDAATGEILVVMQGKERTPVSLRATAAETLDAWEKAVGSAGGSGSGSAEREGSGS